MRLISLSHVNDPATTSVFPGDPEFRLETVATIGRDGYHLQAVRQGEHTGTHWGAPGHFNPGEPLADELAVSDLHLPAVCVDVRARCAGDADYEVTVADLADWERAHGRIPAGAMVVIRTGWAERWGTPAFANLDAAGVPRHPGFGVEAVRWLIDSGRLGDTGGTGTEAFSPDAGRDTTYAVSKLVYRRHRISLECLTNLAALPPTGAHVLCGGTINRAGSGSPAIVYGLLPAGQPGMRTPFTVSR
jgi:kynurenine formamidase